MLPSLVPHIKLIFRVNNNEEDKNNQPTPTTSITNKRKNYKPDKKANKKNFILK